MTWEKLEQVLIVAIVVILGLTVVSTVALLATQNLLVDPRADEKALALGAVLLFACVALLFLARLVRSLDRGDFFGVESHWGGLGGGVGGWRITRPVAYLLVVVTFAALMAVALARYADPADEPMTSTSEKSTTTEETTTTAKQDSKPAVGVSSTKGQT